MTPTLSRRGLLTSSLLPLVATALAASPVSPPSYTCDVFIYGANLGGIMAAHRLSLRGFSVVIAEPTGHVGGMSAAGLSVVDRPRTHSLIGGLTSKFFYAIGVQSGGAAYQYDFEPSVAGQIARRTLAELRDCRVLVNARILGRSEVEVNGITITAIRANFGTVHAAFFIDASYTGDLMAAVTSRYQIGRESAATYGESCAGFQPGSAFVSTQYKNAAHAYGMRPAPDSKLGDGDHKTMSYNFRFVVTRDKANRLPFPRPAGYDASRYALFQQDLVLNHYATLNALIGQYGVLPNNKLATNSGSLISMDLPGLNWGYPDATWVMRDVFIQTQLSWDLGMLYFLANDPSVPAALQADARQWGFCADEFQDSPYGRGVSHNIYERETRRLVGRRVFTQADQQAPGNTKAHSIGRYQFQRDCHGVQQYVDAAGRVVVEGETAAGPIDIFQYPAECLMPQVGDVQNLLVLFCGSNSHVGFLTVRYEPFLGIQGEAAGEIAAQCIAAGRAQGQAFMPTYTYSYPRLASALREYGSVL